VKGREEAGSTDSHKKIAGIHRYILRRGRRHNTSLSQNTRPHTKSKNKNRNKQTNKQTNRPKTQ